MCAPATNHVFVSTPERVARAAHLKEAVNEQSLADLETYLASAFPEFAVLHARTFYQRVKETAYARELLSVAHPYGLSHDEEVELLKPLLIYEHAQPLVPAPLAVNKFCPLSFKSDVVKRDEEAGTHYYDAMTTVLTTWKHENGLVSKFLRDLKAEADGMREMAKLLLQVM